MNHSATNQSGIRSTAQILTANPSSPDNNLVGPMTHSRTDLSQLMQTDPSLSKLIYYICM